MCRTSLTFDRSIPMPNATVAMTISRVSFAKASCVLCLFLASSPAWYGCARSPDVVRDFASLSVSRRELQ